LTRWACSIQRADDKTGQPLVALLVLAHADAIQNKTPANIGRRFKGQAALIFISAFSLFI